MLLSELLQPVTNSSDFPAIFAQYHEQRIDVLQEYLEFGRMQEHRFLHPELYLHDEAPLPLAT
jgi:hypothetical protein